MFEALPDRVSVAPTNDWNRTEASSRMHRESVLYMMLLGIRLPWRVRKVLRDMTEMPGERLDVWGHVIRTPSALPAAIYFHCVDLT